MLRHMSSRRMNRISALALVALGLGIAWSLPSRGAALGQDEPVARARIGTVDATAAAVAYVRSKRHAEQTRALVAERDEAAATGDKKRVKEVEARGAAQQKLAHEVVFEGKQPERIAEMCRDVWPEVAESAGVDAIVLGVIYAAPGREVVDVTEKTLTILGADEKTRSTIAELKAKKAAKK